MEDDMIVVAPGGRRPSAGESLAKAPATIALLDLRMPVLDGVGAIGEIRQFDEAARIVVLTTYDSDNDIYRAIKAGTKGYLLKDTRREELLECIRKVAAGETCLPPALMEKLIVGMRSEPLTEREAEVLQLLLAARAIRTSEHSSHQ